MRAELIRFCRSEQGASSIEYAVMAGGIALPLVATIAQVGSSVGTLYAGILSNQRSPQSAERDPQAASSLVLRSVVRTTSVSQRSQA
jgi:Flp pilus assembly pilin Flp